MQWRVRIDREAVGRQLTHVVGRSPEAKAAAFKKMSGIFERSKRSMMREFDRHPITAELLMGPRGINISNTMDGYGNLFAFIGFSADSTPTSDLRVLLDIGTHFRQTVYANRKFYFRVSTPSQQAIENVTPMPWERGNSWAYAVEHGISNLSFFMAKHWGRGRSREGFQLPYENNDGLSFIPRPYMTEILEHFRDRINNKTS